MADTADATPDLGDLLEFEPVVRRYRVDGWTAESQRAFIAALAMTGSPRRAAKAIGKNAYNAGQLRLAEGAEGFSAAWDKAMKIAQQRQSERLSDRVADLAQRMAPPPPASRQDRRGADHPDPSADEPAPDADDGLAKLLFDRLITKIWQERQARLAGQVIAADFYLRQATYLEVAFDLAAELKGVSAWELLDRMRRDGHHMIAIAQTPFSRLLDEARRLVWRDNGEPERPEHPPQRYLSAVEPGKGHDGYWLEPPECARGGTEVSIDDQRRAFEERHRLDALAQAEWEAKAQSVRGTGEH